MFSSPLLLIVLLHGGLLVSLPVSGNYLYYVKPLDTSNSTCPGEPCHILDFYARNAHSLLSGKNSSVTILFLEGNHYLSEDLEINMTAGVQMLSAIMPEAESAVSIVNVSAGIGMKFTLINNLQMSNLSFLACHQFPTTMSITASLIGNFSHQSVMITCCDLNMNLVSHVDFTHSQYSHCSITWSNDDDRAVSTVLHSFLSDFALIMSYCHFLNSSQIIIKFQNSTKISQLKGSITDSSISYIRYDVRNVTHFYLEITNCHSTVRIIGNIDNDSSSVIIVENSSIADFYLSSHDYIYKNRTLLVTNCKFIFTGLGLFWSSKFSISTILVSQSTLQGFSVHFLFARVCRLSNVTFINSLLYISGPYNSGPTFVEIEHCVFKSGVPNFSKLLPSPFIVSNVKMTFSGESKFINNTGYNGGALYMFNSHLQLAKEATVIFANNSANDTGGAIYVDNPVDNEFTLSYDIPAPVPCIFSLNYDLDLESGEKPNSSIYFSGNNAMNGGNDIYGTSLKSKCLVSTDGKTHSYEVRNDIFKFDNESFYSISSNPKRVCLCENDIPQCASYLHIFQEKRHAPGEEFNISLALVGYDFGTTTGSVHLILYSTHDASSKHTVKGLSSNTCSTLQYAVDSQNNSVDSVSLFLASDIIYILENEEYFAVPTNSIDNYKKRKFIDNKLSTTPILLKILIQKCPLGFTIKDARCQCNEELRENGVSKCQVVSGEGRVNRSGTIWVSRVNQTAELKSTRYSARNNEGVVIYKYCPEGFCKSNEIAVNLYDPDSQCDMGHSGILCGQCAPNLSLALGSSKCLPCSDNRHLSILLAFVAAGLFLILFIKIFNFTITTGAVNGLTLYANVVWINRSVFFPITHQQSSTFFHFLTTFIAWINLDLGIQTCFIRDLDMYWKTWLQYLFPLYIWGLAGLIILGCHFSPKLTKLFGSNSVPLLGTMFLLSYSKLLRTIITSLNFALLYYPQEIKVVWLADGNVSYFGLRHSFLFLMALIFLIIFLIPYTIAMILTPSLRRCDVNCVFKLKPFYDAHFGPLKDQHHYWIGLTLLVRVILAISSVATHPINPMVNIFVTVVFLSLLGFIVGKVYKTWQLSFLEASFIVNLIILGCAFLYSREENVRFVFVSISAGVAFLAFLAVLAVQGYRQLKPFYSRIRASISRRGYENIDRERRTEASMYPTHSVVSIDGVQASDLDHVSFRDSILEYESDI